MLLHIAGDSILISHPYQYLIFAGIATVLIAVIMRHVRSAQAKLNNEETKSIWHIDYRVPLFVGTLELLIYPVLISSGHLDAIGWWLGVKTAASWRWRDQQERGRQLYTNFLFGNALVIAASLLIAIKVST